MRNGRYVAITGPAVLLWHAQNGDVFQKAMPHFIYCNCNGNGNGNGNPDFNCIPHCAPCTCFVNCALCVCISEQDTARTLRALPSCKPHQKSENFTRTTGALNFRYVSIAYPTQQLSNPATCSTC
ncbi:hypothetical protein ACLKA7_001141 [Drosophila subpalustris]